MKRTDFLKFFHACGCVFLYILVFTFELNETFFPMFYTYLYARANILSNLFIYELNCGRAVPLLLCPLHQYHHKKSPSAIPESR